MSVEFLLILLIFLIGFLVLLYIHNKNPNSDTVNPINTSRTRFFLFDN